MRPWQVRDIQLSDAVHVLQAEAQSPPGIGQLRLACRHQHVVRPPPFVDPALRGGGVHLPDDFRRDPRLDCVTRRLDPAVLAPHGCRLRLADEIPDKSAVALGGDRASWLRLPQLLQMPARHCGIGEPVAEQRLGGDVPTVSSGQQPGLLAEVGVGEGPDVDVTHARRLGAATQLREEFRPAVAVRIGQAGRWPRPTRFRGVVC